MFDKSIYIQRRAQLRKDVKTGLLLFPANSEASSNYSANTYSFRQDSNFLYFFGLNEPDMVGVVDADSGVDSIYANDLEMDDIIWMGQLPTVKELAAQVGVEHTAPKSALIEVVANAYKQGRTVHYVYPYRCKTSNYLLDLINYSKPINTSVSQAYEELKNHQSVEMIKAIIKQRSIKSTEEIIEIEKAVKTAYDMHVLAMGLCKEGVYEYEIAGKMEGIAIQNNGGVSFPVILSVNGQTLHNHYHGNKLTKGRMVVADAGAETSMRYCSDITRTTPVGGKFDARQKSIYEIVLQANTNVIDALKPGVPYRDYHWLACKTIAQGLKSLGLMKGNVEDAVAQGAHALFMPHGLGHMMGLDVHDMENMGENLFGYDEEIKRSSQFGLAYLRLGKKLESGFVLTVEPGTYFIPALIDQWKAENKFADFINYDEVEKYKDFGGVRIEDDVLITPEGHRVLGPAIPKTVAEIEAL